MSDVYKFIASFIGASVMQDNKLINGICNFTIAGLITEVRACRYKTKNKKILGQSFFTLQRWQGKVDSRRGDFFAQSPSNLIPVKLQYTQFAR